MTAEDDKRAAIGLLEREWHALDAWLVRWRARCASESASARDRIHVHSSL